MSQTVPKRYIRSIRKQFILDNIGLMDQQAIADKMGVGRKQIVRDIRQLKDSGVWVEWIESELLRLHKSHDIDDLAKYKEMSKLYSKTLVDKREVETKQTHIINVVYSSDMKDEPEDKLSTT